MVLALVSIVRSIKSLPEEFKAATEIASLCVSIPIHFTLSKRALLSELGSSRTLKTCSNRGALFYGVA